MDHLGKLTLLKAEIIKSLMTKSKTQNSKQNGKKKDKPKKSPLSGFLPCFSKHQDGKYTIDAFYDNHVFVNKMQEFAHAIIISPTTQILAQAIHAKGGIQPIDPIGNADDRKLCQSLGWQTSKVYRVDYRDNPYRLLFGLDNTEKRCYILALDTDHQTRPGKYK
jgi:hypothetical protein